MSDLTEDVGFDPDVDKIVVNEETKKGLKGLREFITYWDKDLKPFARKCIELGLPLYIELSQVSNDTDRFIKDNDILVTPDAKDDELKYKYEDGTALKSDDLKVVNAFKKQSDKILTESHILGIVDFMAIHYISEMMYGIEHDIAEFRNPAIRMTQVYGNLSDKVYYDMYKNDECEEAKNYKELANKLEHAFEILKDVK